MNMLLKSIACTTVLTLFLAAGFSSPTIAHAADSPVLPESCSEEIGCDGLCGSGKVVDACGMCGGPGVNLSGCCGGQTKDACGICGGSGVNPRTGCCATQVKGCDGVCGSGKVAGCDGVCGSSKTIDVCGVCGGTGINPATGCCGTITKGCDGICGSAKSKGCDGVCGSGKVIGGCDNKCGSTKAIDACGVCGGPGRNTTGCCGDQVKGCDGVCGSGKVIGGCDTTCGSTKSIDACGICGGPGINPTTGCCGTQVKGCDGICGSGKAVGCDGVCGSGKVISGCDRKCSSTKTVDACGVCGGTGVNPTTGCCGTQVKGCDGVCGSGKVKGCDGVCGSAKRVDACGICGGAGVNPATGCCGTQVKGCDGVCGSGKVKGCDGICGSGKVVGGCDAKCGSIKTVDVCGVCGGSGLNPATGCCGTLTKGCDGVCGSGKVVGCDGVCGSGKVVGGCDNTCGSTKRFDACGVCGGSGNIRDNNNNQCCSLASNGCCPGISKDACGVCGGTGTYFTVDIRNWHVHWEDDRGWWREFGGGGASSCLQQIAASCGLPAENVTAKNTADNLSCIRRTMQFTNQSDCERSYRPGQTNAGVEATDGSANCYREATRYIDGNCNVTKTPPAGTACAGSNTLWTFRSPISLVWDAKAGEALAKEQHVAEFVLTPGDAARYADWRGSAAWPLLVHDPDGKGEIRDGAQLFGENAFGKKWQSGFEALSSLDANGDSKIAGQELKGLALWFDGNRNGKSEPGEVKSLESQDVTTLYFKNPLRRPHTPADLELKVGYERRIKGKVTKGQAIDWYGKVYNEKISSRLSPASTARAAQVAAQQPLGPVSGLWFWQTKEQVEGARRGGVLALEQHGTEILGESYTERPVDPNGTGVTAIATAATLHGKLEATELRFAVAGRGGMATVTTAKLSDDGTRLDGETIEEGRRTDSGESYALRYTWYAERAGTLKR